MRVEKKEIKVIQGRLIDGTGSTPTKEAIVATNKNAPEYACNLEKIKMVMRNGEIEVNRGL